MTSHTTTPPAGITCIRCDTTFDQIFAPDQAYGCASELRGDEVRGHYGSYAFDGDTGYLVDGMAHGLTDGLICDTCIEKMIAGGVLLRCE